MAKYVDAEHTMIHHDGHFIPVTMDNRHYRQLLDDGVEVAPFVPESKPVDPPSEVEELLVILYRLGVITVNEVIEL